MGSTALARMVTRLLVSRVALQDLVSFTQPHHDAASQPHESERRRFGGSCIRHRGILCVDSEVSFASDSKQSVSCRAPNHADCLIASRVACVISSWLLKSAIVRQLESSSTFQRVASTKAVPADIWVDCES